MGNSDKQANADNQAIVVHDGSGRRRFIRRGAAFIAAGSSLAASQSVYADDCDRNQGSEKNAQAPGSDSDQGAEADPTGCGRSEPPKISQSPDATNSEQTVKIKKIEV